MRLIWTVRARIDLGRVHDFLAPKNPRPARAVVDALAIAPNNLLLQPRIGQRLDAISRRETRRIFVGHYEIRYELRGEDIRVLRIFHTREER